MQVIQTANDNIKVLYSPGMESLCLGDFLLVQEGKKRFLAQITDIRDEKFDQSQNIAQIKLLFTVNENDEILPYDNHTPSKECKILHTRQKDIEDFVNIDKETFELAINPRTNLPLEFNLHFFENNPLIFSDKLEQTNALFRNLSEKLWEHNSVVVFDYTGSLEIEGAKRITALDDFKLPLNPLTLDSIWEKGLSTASLETQAVCEEIFNEVKNYIMETEDKYLPFNQFLKVIEGQHAKTPITELLVLKNRLIKYQQSGIFAKSKKEFQAISKNKSKVTIIDISPLKLEWHRDFTAFALNEIRKNSFVMLRMNDTNSDLEFIKELYEKDLNVIPSISYSFKRTVSIAERCPNYILLPTLNPKRDFGYISGAISSLNKDHALLWGVDTKNFIFTMTNKLEGTPIEYSTDIKPVKMKIIGSEEILDVSTAEISPEDKELQEFLSLKQSMAEEPPEPEKKASAINTLRDRYRMTKKTAEEVEEESYQEPAETISHEEAAQEEAQDIDMLKESVSTDDVEEYNESQEPVNFKQEVSFEPQENVYENYAPIPPAEPADVIAEEIISEEELDFFETMKEQPQEQENVAPETFSEEIIEEAPYDVIEEASYEEEEMYVSPRPDTQSFIEEIEEDEPLSEVAPIQETAVKETNAVKNSIEASFEEIMNGAPEDASNGKLMINDSVSIDLSTIKDKIPKDHEDLPLFPPEGAEEYGLDSFSEGDEVEHDKYGPGKVLKVVKYANRCLLQIEFKEVGKRLLDPRIAHIRRPV